MRVVIALDSFKGSIGAAGAAAALAGGWRSVRPGDEVVCVPLADGGEGTLDVLAAAVSGARWHQARVTGPAGQPVDSAWLELPGAVAAVELARASGLPLMARPDPLGAQTTGYDRAKGAALAQFLCSAVSKGQAIAPTLKYARLSSELVNIAIDAIVRIPGALHEEES